MIFALGITCSLITQLSEIQYLEENSKDITIWYNITLGFVSVFCIAFGYAFLFVKPNLNRKSNPNSNPNNGHKIGSDDKGMGLVVGTVSLLVLALEITLMNMVFKREDIRMAFSIYLGVFAIEKIVLAGVYLHIRRLTFDEEYKSGAAFYFRFLSFINFTLWLNNIPFTDVHIYDKQAHGNVDFKYIEEIYKALIIDYRLLCALLFLEHAIEIGQADEHEHHVDEIDQNYQLPMKRCSLHTVVGFGIGLVFLALEIVNAMRFWGMSIPEWVNIFPIFLDVGLAVLAVNLLKKGVERSFFHTEKVGLVTLMVSFMGGTGAIYLITFGLLSLTSDPDSYLIWSAVVFLVRGISLLVLLIVYTGIPVGEMKLSKHFKNENYLLVSFVFAGLFARFVGNILGEFNSTIHEVEHHYLQTNKSRTLKYLFSIGPLFQLAASLHLALHFLLFIWRLHCKPETARNNTNVEQHKGNQNDEPARDDCANDLRVVRNPHGTEEEIKLSCVLNVQSHDENEHVVTPDDNTRV